jgi:GcrA cell cycle regulator
MASEPALKNHSMQQLIDRRRPDLRLLEASNRQPAAVDHIPVAQRRSIITVETSRCRWPIGDPRTKAFYLCGGETYQSDSYCTHHMKLAFQKPYSQNRNPSK